jgi:hypothetical protein
MMASTHRIVRAHCCPAIAQVVQDEWKDMLDGKSIESDQRTAVLFDQSRNPVVRSQRVAGTNQVPKSAQVQTRQKQRVSFSPLMRAIRLWLSPLCFFQTSS